MKVYWVRGTCGDIDCSGMEAYRGRLLGFLIVLFEAVHGLVSTTPTAAISFGCGTDPRLAALRDGPESVRATRGVSASSMLGVGAPAMLASPNSAPNGVLVWGRWG
jgi:hypothetical protein